MIFGFFERKNSNRRIVDRQYRHLTEVARHPGFYRQGHVPDTVMGRFEMLSLVMILYLRAARTSGPQGEGLAQEIIDAFFQDIDHSIRELGVGDQSVPKRMKKLAGMFYGRLESYGQALDLENKGGLAVALKRNIHPERHNPPDMEQLAAWAMAAEAAAGAMTHEMLAAGQIVFPLPEDKDDDEIT
ncbi:ubiquinol-cytochrome C chaperone [Allorhizobium sp. BGMRC 0089]|uniref:ubiquinol-cytochrome C chaperone family protein n=1 Tax=Allorhizobium sonneratiae TaxID=2934936 RepID=UPI00203357CC|nr:ubiquinol-cytochrome C chaperone family protein [Allorhizobium sonneratiae]MCM2292126.1 ubiquinol-cytochrome C chaperone [Allorhizobium sonneratiae]